MKDAETAFGDGGAEFAPSESDEEDDDMRGSLHEYINDEHTLLKKEGKKEAKRKQKQPKDRRNRFDNRKDSGIAPMTTDMLEKASDDKGWDDLRNYTNPKPLKNMPKPGPKSSRS
jgi:hypothetical protein